MTVQDDTPAQFASPPCFMHELDENYIGVTSETRSPQTRDVARWRKSERQRLIAERLAIEPGTRKRYSAEIIRKLDAIIGTPHRIRGERLLAASGGARPSSMGREPACARRPVRLAGRRGA